MNDRPEDDLPCANSSLPTASPNKTSLAALFADSPFARLVDFEETLLRERAPCRALPGF